MFFFSALLLGALAALSMASDVVVLTSANFDSQIESTAGSTSEDWLIKFYAPWCGHCTKLAPAWDELATKLKGEVNVAKVDVTENRDLGTQFDVKGFPTIKFLKKGKVYDFRGARTVDAFTDFVRQGYSSAATSERKK